MIALEEFSSLTASIYDAALDAAHWDATLERMVAAFGATGAALLVAEPALRRIQVKSIGADPAFVKGYNDYYGRLDPVAAVIEQAPAGAILADYEVVSCEEKRRSEFYNDWAIPNQCGEGVFARLLREETGTSWLCIAAPINAQSFATSERLKLARLFAPHFQQAIRMQLKLGELGAARDRALSALDRLKHGIVLAARDAKVLFANAAALEIFRECDGLAVREACLRATLANEDASLLRLVGLAICGEDEVRSGGGLTVTRPSGRRPFGVDVLPLRAPFDEFSQLQQGAMILIVDPERDVEPPAHTWRRLYGLTKAEAAVAVSVLRGAGLQAVADELSVSLSTVRIHLQRVFEKTGTHRQAQLVRLLLQADAGADPVRFETEGWPRKP